MVVAAIEGVVNEVVAKPPVKTEPPVAAAYQSMVSPELGVAEIPTIPVKQRLAFPAVGNTGIILIVTEDVATTAAHPPAAAIV